MVRNDSSGQGDSKSLLNRLCFNAVLHSGHKRALRILSFFLFELSVQV